MKAKRIPYFPFYPRDFASDGKVEAMTTLEVGCHILLICKAWDESPPGTLPDDDQVLSSWSRVTVETWATCKPRVMAAWSIKRGRWHQTRLVAVREVAEAAYGRRAESGRLGGLAKAAASKAPSNATAMLQHPSSNALARAFDCRFSSSSESLSSSSEARANERERMVDALCGVGFAPQKAIKLAGTPGLTTDRIAWLVEKASKPNVDSKLGMILDGIRNPDQYPVERWTGPAEPPPITVEGEYQRLCKENGVAP